MGLTWRQALAAIVGGNVIVFVLLAVNSLPGMFYHSKAVVSGVSSTDGSSWFSLGQPVCLGSVWEPVCSMEQNLALCW
jgi:hypothetical protein